jgi:hypothetical protein
MRRGLLATGPAAAWFDLAGVVALRLDDPGASASVQLDGWAYDRAGSEVWETVGDILERQRARMTVGYTPGWVDDGDPGRGELRVGGRSVDRVPGKVHPSPRVEYEGRLATSGDFATEFTAVRALESRGVAEIELHGYTHVRPDLERWARSPTAHEKVGWYRELGPETTGELSAIPVSRRPLALGHQLFSELFDSAPRALLCPGNACAPQTATEAFELGLEAIAATSLAVRCGDRFEWLPEVPTIPIDWASADALAGETPVVAGLHDRDLALHGPAWLDERLDEWRRAGARRFVGIGDLVSIFGLDLQLAPDGDGWRLLVRRDHGAPLVEPAGVLLRAPALDRRIELSTPDGAQALEATPVAAGLWRAELPAGV